MIYPTWSDLNDESIVPPLGDRSAPGLAPVAVMISCEPDFRLIRSHMAALPERSFFNSTLITGQNRDKGICIVGPFIGAPYAAMILESLIAKGVKKIIMLGWCGAVSETLSVGDLVLPQKAIADEGTSRNYCRPDKTLPCTWPDTMLGRQLADVLGADGIPYREAVIWTTDAIYRETPGKVSFFRQKGAMAVEMECSALFSVARFRKIPITSLLVVSDSVAARAWDPGFRKKKFIAARKTACEIVMKLAKKV